MKNKVVLPSNIATPKQTVYGTGKKLSKSKSTKQYEEKINSIINSFILKKKKSEKKIIDRITKGRIIRHIWTLFETKKEKRK